MRPEHAPLVGTALLQSRAVLGAAAGRDADTATYGVVQETRRRGAQRVRPLRAEARVA